MSNGDNRWGKTPFRIGLWVGGSTTPNWTSDADEAIKAAHGRQTQIRGGRRRGITAPTDELPVVRHQDRPRQTHQGREVQRGSLPHADLLRGQVRPVQVLHEGSAGRRTARDGSGRGNLSTAPVAAHHHCRQVRSDALERGGADALWSGRRPLRTPRVPVAAFGRRLRRTGD